MRTILIPLLSLTALALGVTACGGATADFEPNGGGAAGTENTDEGNDDADVDGGDSTEDASADGDDGSDDPEVPGPTISFACPGGTIAEGSNEITIDGKKRTFLVDLPSDTDGPLGVVFSWHGYGDSASNFRSALGLDPDASSSQPLIVITPEDSGLQPVGGQPGLDWDILAGKPGDANIDIAFFEAMLGCVNEQYSLDSTRVYSLGFSAGSVFTALLHSRYPELFAATVHLSGAWMNDPEQTNLVPKLLPLNWSWPELDPADGGHVLLTHGGDSDAVGAMGVTVINLEDAAQAALPFLEAAGRTVVDCVHDNGHTLHPELSAATIVDYLVAHRKGAPSPYANDGLEGFPDSCTLRKP